MRVLGHRVLVVPDDAPTMTASGLLLPQDRPYQPTSGTVHLVGEGSAHDARIRQAAIKKCIALLDKGCTVAALRHLLQEGDLAPTVEVGQHVIFPAECGLNITDDGTPYVLLNEDDLVIAEIEVAA